MVHRIHGKNRQIQERNGYSNIKDTQIGVGHPSEWLFICFFIELDKEGQGNQGKITSMVPTRLGSGLDGQGRQMGMFWNILEGFYPRDPLWLSSGQIQLINQIQ